MFVRRVIVPLPSRPDDLAAGGYVQGMLAALFKYDEVPGAWDIERESAAAVLEEQAVERRPRRRGLAISKAGLPTGIQALRLGLGAAD